MDKIDNYLLDNISLFLDFESYENIRYISSYNKDYKNNYLEDYYKKKKELILSTYDKNIIRILGGMKKFIEFPTLKWDDKFMGGTGYIDKIDVNDVSAPIMLGLDIWSRPFITLKVYEGSPKILTLFQRYTNDNTTWTHGTKYPNNIIWTYSPFLSDNTFTCDVTVDNIKSLALNKKSITIYSSLHRTSRFEKKVKDNVFLIN